tara:strand:+ start:274 stop:822 length:549 start_codon:yes stop_codon:yes gene_type:complete
MLNHVAKALIGFISCFILSACHKPAVLDDSLALSILNQSQQKMGYAVNIVSNSPTARDKKISGWSCADKADWVGAGVVKCNKSGRSGVYLTFTTKGKKLLIGELWGNSGVRNARVLAVTRHAQSINAITLINKNKAKVSYNWVYDKHTPFSNDHLKKLIPLNAPKTGEANFILRDKQWKIEN